MAKKEWEKEFDGLIAGTCWNPHCARDANCQEDRKKVKQFINSLLAKQKKESFAKGYVEGLCENERIVKPRIKKEIIEKLEKALVKILEQKTTPGLIQAIIEDLREELNQ